MEAKGCQRTLASRPLLCSNTAMQKIWFKYVILPLAICGIGIISTYFWLRTSMPQIEAD
jgi:hypothetical protein